ncbi:MAG: hypothetical protein QNJ31_02100 [Candidatus Caenarcaniphilales bacterium]|nr:hypothetical protein [Candidatus Caenarcaniphilales bacterium]
MPFVIGGAVALKYALGGTAFYVASDQLKGHFTGTTISEDVTGFLWSGGKKLVNAAGDTIAKNWERSTSSNPFQSEAGAVEINKIQGEIPAPTDDQTYDQRKTNSQRLLNEINNRLQNNSNCSPQLMDKLVGNLVSYLVFMGTHNSQSLNKDTRFIRFLKEQINKLINSDSSNCISENLKRNLKRQLKDLTKPSVGTKIAVAATGITILVGIHIWNISTNNDGTNTISVTNKQGQEVDKGKLSASSLVNALGGQDVVFNCQVEEQTVSCKINKEGKVVFADTNDGNEVIINAGELFFTDINKQKLKYNISNGTLTD